MTDKQQRAEQVNQVIRIIGSHGRRFFYKRSTHRFAHIEVGPSGHMWWHDHYSGKRVYISSHGPWRGFTSGGTLRRLVEAFRDYVRTGKPISEGYLGPENRFSNGNIWGYEDADMQRVRQEARALPVFQQPVDGEGQPS